MSDAGDGFEERLDELREEARRSGRVEVAGGRASRAPLPGYYGTPILKPPVWTWEIPVYFFVGGLAGMSAVIGAAALLVGAAPAALARVALTTAAVGALVSTGLLVSDLGRPRRFLNMLRVFKWRSPMSVGAWLLSAFGGAATLAAVLALWPAGAARWTTVLYIAALLAALLGAVLATYTGVLIGATVVPAWHTHRALLPVHFGVAGLGSAAAFLQLLGFRSRALLALGILAAAVEIVVGALVELRRHGAADRALRRGHAGLALRLGGLLAGPAAFVLWVLGLVPWGAACFLAGSLVSRFGWLEAGKASAGDVEAVLAAQR